MMKTSINNNKSEIFIPDNRTDYEYLPCYEKVKIEVEKATAERRKNRVIEIINRNKNLIKETRSMNKTNLLFGLIALIIAGLVQFGVITPGIESLILPVVAAVAGVLGVSNWRNNYGIAKDWFKSKSIVFAIGGAVLVTILVVNNAFVLGVPNYITEIINWIVVALGGGVIYGIFNAVKENKTV